MVDSDFTVRKGLLVRDGNVSLRGDNKELRFYEGANYVGFEAPALSADKIWVLPAADGSTGQALKTDGSGNLGWVTAGDVTLTGTQTLTNKTITSPNGIASAPSYSFANSTNSGLWYATDFGNPMLMFQVNGSTVVRVGGASAGAVKINEAYTLPTTVTGANDRVLTAQTDGSTAWTTISSGASDIGALDDVLVDATNWVDGFLLQPESNGSAPTTGTLNGATGNIGLGVDVFNTLTEGDYNVGIGYQASDSLTTGSENVHIGYQAGQSNNTGSKNVFVGSGAGYSDPNGLLGVAIGYRACFSGGMNYGVAVGGEANYSAGSNVTAIGYRAHKYHTGQFNVAIGRDALDASGAGSHNVAIGGRHALGALTSGARNIGIGYQSLDGATTESDNIAIGYDALGGSVAGGQYNVSIGNYSLDALTSASYNVAIGHEAGTIIVDGAQNVLVGYGAAGNADIGNNNVLVGMQAGYGSTDATQSVAIGNDAGKFGLKSATGSIAMGQNALKGHSLNSTGANYNTAIGHYSMEDVTTGDDNTAVGSYSLLEVTTGATNIAIGHDAGNNITTGSNNVVIGAADVASATGSDQLSISSGDGSPVWITGNSSGVVDFPNGLTNNGAAIESAFETITDVTIGSGTSGTTSGIYFGANNEAGVVAGEVSSQSVASNGYIELMNCDLDAESGASGLQTIELTVQIQDETNNNVESFKALVQGIEKTVLGTTVREVNYTEWAVIYTSGANRIGQLEADYDSSDDTIRIRYKHTQSSTATLTATFYAVTMQNNT
jgi:hypothetical protein